MIKKKQKPEAVIVQQAVPWPDWKDEKSYPVPKTPAEGWAWEFLRRNQGYQNKWLEYVASTGHILGKFGPEKGWGISVMMGTEVWYFDPPAMPGETQNEWRMRVRHSGAEPIGPLPLSQGMARGWGLVEMFDPALSWEQTAGLGSRPRFLPQGPTIYFCLSDLEDTDHLAQPMLPRLPSRPDVAIVQIDMARSLPAQLEDVEHRLKKKQDELEAQGVLRKAKKGHKTSHYRDLLRIFDAYSAREKLGSKSSKGSKLSNEEIANVLYAGNEESGTAQSISARYATAREYVNKGYLSLLE